MFSALRSALTPAPKNPAHAQLAARRPIKTAYLSNAVPLPPTFLTGPDPPDARPITAAPIDWTTTPIPEYDGLYAVVLDHVLSPAECAALLRLAEASVPADGQLRNGADDAWGPALVNVGGGFEVLEPEYRNSDRIVWDCQAVVDRLWARCLRAEGVRERFALVAAAEEKVVGRKSRKGGEGVWRFLRVNERMRFLRYGKGGFFRSHCDGSFADTSDPARTIRTLFTLHLYLNDSKAEGGRDAELVGGATSFFSSNGQRKIDVNAKAGRVLIFQHKGLLHSGDDVLAGTKYTMRTDIMYEFIRSEEGEEVQSAPRVLE
ncbi:hypothetical protein BT67DRAFT_446864 [Trichocladium antarcticum]|uniref:Prolyl 4-hydroxylase alpha subunit domain-containing protein n=1 Tax=Trichocladium antarcticum TaxID=1450529 RepID=A0AAN6ZH12_9PEZI|nr:hypothetical protein BT67DRAFT_446864 [Trichocladium antarcticum]